MPFELTFPWQFEEFERWQLNLVSSLRQHQGLTSSLSSALTIGSVTSNPCSITSKNGDALQLDVGEGSLRAISTTFRRY